MDTDVNYTIVGAFVILLIASFVLGIIWLSSGFAIKQYSIYQVYMQESVSGLSIDSAVEYNGVDVGSVKSIELNHKNPKLVELLLNIKSETPITRGTVATLQAKGITGLTYVALKDKSTEDLRPLVAEKGQDYPVIKTSPSIFTRLDTALSELSIKFGKISDAISSLLDKENQESIKASLHHLEVITNSLATDSGKFHIIVENTARASQEFWPVLQSSTNAIKALQAQTLPATYRLLANLNEITQNLSEVSAELKQNPSVLIRGINRQGTGPGEK